MPVYTYTCQKCGADFEVRLSFAEFDRARPRCTKCGSARARRRIAAPGTRIRQGPKLTRAQMEAAVRKAEAQGLGERSTDPAPGHNHSKP